MSLKRIEIYNKISNHFKKALNSKNIFQMPRIILKKKSLAGIAALPKWPVEWVKKGLFSKSQLYDFP
jgi:hypothetical protein